MQAQPRIASSEIMDALFCDTTRFRETLETYVSTLIDTYGGETSLPEHFRAIPNRIICICPMVLCHAFLKDIGLETPHDFLGPLGLAMYSISTHDDIVDERPESRAEVAGLVYAGNIASLHGISLLIEKGYANIAQTIIRLMNLNHCFQTDIVFSLWERPSDEIGYLNAIRHTGYWAAIGIMAAAEHERSINGEANYEAFAMKFGELYGRMCQVYDDIREIDDDIRNGYFSLPISIALQHGYDLTTSEGREKATIRSKEISKQSFLDVCTLCGDAWPSLLALAKRMHNVGQQLMLTH